MSAADVLLFAVFVLVIFINKTQGNNAPFGEHCTVDKNCASAQMVCGSSICRCFRGHYPSEDKTNCIATTNGLCFDESDCRSLPHSRCLFLDSEEGTCTCNDGYSSTEEGPDCLPNAGYRGSCEQTVQCTVQLGHSSECKEGLCDCQANSHYSVQDGKCILTVGLLGPCVNTSQCVIESEKNVDCIDGRCTCAEGYEQFGDKCEDGAQKVTVSGAVFLLLWIIKFIIS